MNKQTANEYNTRLSNFEKFVKFQYGSDNNLDKFLKELKEGKLDVYEILGDYCIYLQNSNLHASTLKQRIVTAKNFLEFNDIDISPRKFKLKIRLPKNVKKSKQALDKEEIIEILNGCSDLKLKTYVMLLASTGMRATEALSIRLRDLDFESVPAKVTIRAEYTKTKVGRYVFLTKEMVQQFKKWENYKYRTRRVCGKDKETGKIIDEYRTPNKKLNDLVFSTRNNNYGNNKISNSIKNSTRSPRSIPQNNYHYIVALFDKTLDRIGMGSREDGNETRREITLHSLRRWVKSTISDLGYSDYSEWFIGHIGSEYWKRKDSEKAEIFKKIEPYLTFLNVPQLERQGADLQTKIEELQEINHLLRNKYTEKEGQIKKLEESVAFLADKFNAFLVSQPGNRLVYHDDDENNSQIKGIELKPEISHKAIGKVIPSNGNNKKK